LCKVINLCKLKTMRMRINAKNLQVRRQFSFLCSLAPPHPHFINWPILNTSIDNNRNIHALSNIKVLISGKNTPKYDFIFWCWRRGAPGLSWYMDRPLENQYFSTSMLAKSSRLLPRAMKEVLFEKIGLKGITTF